MLLGSRPADILGWDIGPPPYPDRGTEDLRTYFVRTPWQILVVGGSSNEEVSSDLVVSRLSTSGNGGGLSGGSWWSKRDICIFDRSGGSPVLQFDPAFCKIRRWILCDGKLIFTFEVDGSGQREVATMGRHNGVE
jgi:hypothetical protein